MRRTISGVLDGGTEGQMQHGSFLSIQDQFRGNFCECVIKSQEKRIIHFQPKFRSTQGCGEYCEKMRSWFCPKCFQKVVSSSSHSSPIIPAHTHTHSHLDYHEVLSGASKAYKPNKPSTLPNGHSTIYSPYSTTTQGNTSKLSQLLQVISVSIRLLDTAIAAITLCLDGQITCHQ